MIKVKLIALGKLKEKYLKDAVAEYEKRLGGYCSLEVLELNPKTLPENPNQTQIDAALEFEADMILKTIPKTSMIAAMCIEGKQYSSHELAEFLEKSASECGCVTFIIGSSYGLSQTIKQKANVKMSMSRMTFPHQLARVMLLEQIYRGFKINEGSAYHK